MEGFDTRAYQRFTTASNNELIPKPLSLYVHLPFCKSLCYYCGCMKKVTRHEHQADKYLDLLAREIELQGELFDRDREVVQLHFGGGTPTFHDDEKLTRLMAQLEANFSLSIDDSREFSIEVDPRTVGLQRLEKLAEMGFNRISLGVQDIDPKVQEAVNRIQDPEATLEMVDGSRKLGFNSVSIDLIYGLPLQTAESFSRTIDTVVGARPDRLAVYNYAHLPHIFRAQRMIDSKDAACNVTSRVTQPVANATSSGLASVRSAKWATATLRTSRTSRPGSRWWPRASCLSGVVRA
jgi:oxygen-independent coproporphyrinogen-3 oxidase